MAGHNVIASVREKIGRLIAENQKLREECGRTLRRSEKLRADNRRLNEQVAELEKRISLLELRNAMAGSEDDRKRAMARVNRLMREIDRCIALMNRA